MMTLTMMGLQTPLTTVQLLQTATRLTGMAIRKEMLAIIVPTRPTLFRRMLMKMEEGMFAMEISMGMDLTMERITVPIL